MRDLYFILGQTRKMTRDIVGIFVSNLRHKVIRLLMSNEEGLVSGKIEQVC
jgi:hypothetical protein